MAILVVKIEDMRALPMNEFFDYDGYCYACTRSRMDNSEQCIALEDFYDATVQSSELSDIPVVFVVDGEDTEPDTYRIIGWYEQAAVYRKLQRLSFFMEGNIKADARCVCLLPEKQWTSTLVCHFNQGLYEVIEIYDGRYELLLDWMHHFDGHNVFMRYGLTDIRLDKNIKDNAEKCMDKCNELAALLMQDGCRNIAEIKALEDYAERLSILKPTEADGYYYLAMACHQLGLVKKGMKAIEKALRIEPDASDIMAMKGNLLVSMGRYEAAAALFDAAWQYDGDEDYLLLEGRSWFFGGQADKAFSCFKQMTEKDKLEEAGINLKDMERRWPLISRRGFSFKHFFDRK